jgi:hypothetical protein
MSKPARTELSVFMDEQVYPRLYDGLDTIFPEFGFTPRDGKWEATHWPADFPIQVEHPRPERLQCYNAAPWTLYIHGRGGMLWLQYWNKGKPVTGAVFVELCRYAASKVNVPFPERELSEEEREQARRWEDRKTLLCTVDAECQAYLWTPSGIAVLSATYSSLMRLD